MTPTEVIWSSGNVRIVKDEEDGEFPEWGEGDFFLYVIGEEGWVLTEESIGEPPEHLSEAIERFARDAEKTGKPWRAVNHVQRWLSVFHNPKAMVGEYQGDCPGDRCLVVSMEGDPMTSEHVAAYAFGDVWRLGVEHRVIYHLCTDSVDALPEGAHVHPAMIHKEWVRDIDMAATAYGEDDLEFEKKNLIIDIEGRRQHG